VVSLRLRGRVDSDRQQHDRRLHQFLRMPKSQTSAELAHVRFFRHGHSSRISCTPEYRSWAALRARCKYLKVNSYDRYGGRGITVRKPWEKFENFPADMGPKPSPKHSIDPKSGSSSH